MQVFCKLRKITVSLPAMATTLADLNGNPQSFQLVDLIGDAYVVSRLKEMGFAPGQRLYFVGRAPFSGPFMVRTGSMVFALREEEAQCLRL